MSIYSLVHLSDSTLLHDLAALVRRDRNTTAALLAHIAEVDARKLYRPAAYPSMYAYCVGELHTSEDTAYKRIRAARAARQFPAIFLAIAEGRLNLTSVVMLAPHLTSDTAGDLIPAAAHKTNAEIERLLSERFPRPDLPTLLEAITPPVASGELAVRPVEGPTAQLAVRPVATIAPGPEGPSPTTAAPYALAQIESSLPRPRVAPLAPERFALQVTIERSTHDKLRYAQELLGHQIPASDVAGVIDRALDELIHELEKRKFAATARPRRGQRRPSADGRHVPAEVRRAVWHRDGGRCTFVSDTGHRCEARKGIEFDHIQEFARGGEATASGIRLRCRAHNQYEAERTFGTEFMRNKRQQAQLRATERRARKAVPTPPARTREVNHERDVVARCGS